MYTIVTGMRPGELQSPIHQTFIPESVTLLHTYLQGKNAKTINCKANDEASAALIALSQMGELEVEVIGSYADACVAATVANAIALGFNVKSPEEYLFYLNDNYFKAHVDAFLEYPNQSELGILIQKGVIKPPFSYIYDFSENTHYFNPIKNE